MIPGIIAAKTTDTTTETNAEVVSDFGPGLAAGAFSRLRRGERATPKELTVLDTLLISPP